MTPSSDKRKFLVGYDYGNGGLWGTILARSPEEILEKYPELVVFEKPAEWMSRLYFETLSAEQPSMDIDFPSTGILEAVLKARKRRENPD